MLIRALYSFRIAQSQRSGFGVRCLSPNHPLAMKHLLSLPLLLAFTLTSEALTLPVSEDTSTTTNVKLAKVAGKATTLPVTATRNALIRFEVSAFAGTIPSADVTSARLVLYVSAAKT